MKKKNSNILVIPTEKTEIGAGEFAGTTYKKVIIHGGVKSIGVSAFNAWTTEEVVFEEGIKNIPDGIFSHFRDIFGISGNTKLFHTGRALLSMYRWKAISYFLTA